MSTTPIMAEGPARTDFGALSFADDGKAAASQSLPDTGATTSQAGHGADGMGIAADGQAPAPAAPKHPSAPPSPAVP